jgi:hypothetical protein
MILLLKPPFQPLLTECGGDIYGIMSRKGYFGMVAMSAGDSWGRFRMSALEWSGSTHDSVAFNDCDLYN